MGNRKVKKMEVIKKPYMANVRTATVRTLREEVDYEAIVEGKSKIFERRALRCLKARLYE